MIDPETSRTPCPGPSYLDWSTRGRPAIWRYLVVVVLGFMALLIGGLLFEPVYPLAHTAVDKQAVQLMAFASMWIAAPLLTWALLRRPGYTVAMPGWPPWLRDWLVGVAISVAGLAVSSVLMLPVSPVRWVGWGGAVEAGLFSIALIVLGLIVQTGAEELFFRGLVTQGVFRAARQLSAGLAVALAVVIPSLWFAQLHIGNIKEYGGTWTAGIPYFLMAVLFAWGAVRTGSLLLSAGLHMGNNFFLVFIISNPSDVIGGQAPMVFSGGADLGRSIMSASILVVMGLFLIEWAVRRGIVGPRNG